MSRLAAVLLGATATLAQGLEEQQKARERMEASLAKQRESIRRQVQSASPASPETGFFATPWPWPKTATWSPTPVSTRASSWNCDPLPSDEADKLVNTNAERAGVSPDLLRAVILRESGFRPCAVSVKGAQGLMQLMPGTAAALGVADPMDPGQNIEAGTRFLKSLLDRFEGNVSLALGAYNAGPSRIEQFNGLPPFAETRDYVRSILGSLPPALD